LIKEKTANKANLVIDSVKPITHVNSRHSTKLEEFLLNLKY